MCDLRVGTGACPSRPRRSAPSGRRPASQELMRAGSRGRTGRRRPFWCPRPVSGCSGIQDPSYEVQRCGGDVKGKGRHIVGQSQPCHRLTIGSTAT